MNYIVSKILKYITVQNVISDDEDVQDFYRYGIEIGISSILNIVLVLLLGLIINRVLESIVFLVLFIFIRSFTGGYHADTYFRCNLLMCVTFVITVWVNHMTVNRIPVTILIGLILLTEMIIFVLGPIENKNKPIDDSKKVILKLMGVIVSLMINCVGLLFIDSYIGTMIIYTTFLIATLMVAAIIKEKRGEINESSK